MAVIEHVTMGGATGVDGFVAQHDRFDAARAGEDAAWLRVVRQEALARFVALGFPTTRQEEWRFTNVTPIASTAFRLAIDDGARVRREDLAALGMLVPGALEIVFVNGRFAPHLSTLGRLPAGLEVASIAQVLARDPGSLEPWLARVATREDQPFAALNTAFLGDGAVIRTAPNLVVTDPVHAVFLSVPPFDGGAAFACPRVLVVAGGNSQLRFVERYGSVAAPDAGRQLTSAVTEIVLGDGAVVDHYRVQREATAAAHVSTTEVRLSHSSTFTSHAFTLGGGLVRNDVSARLAGEGADCTLNGLYLADGTRLVDNHTFIDHAEPHCSSHEVYKGILSGQARAVFNGKILVRPDAQKTDAKQTNKTLLLSDDAQINTKPQLEIYANDVKCTHGATVGQLSADALFYLRARGIGREEAQQMLVRAFAADIVSRVRIEQLRDQLDAVIDGLGPATPQAAARPVVEETP